MTAPRRKAGTEESTTCPWCSAAVPATATTCPSCGASLRDAAGGDVAGVTQIDPHAVSRAARIKPGRLTSWLGAETTTESPTLTGKIEPVSEEVRAEMLRLELAALDAEIEAKKTQAAAQRELPLDDDATVPAPAATDEAAPSTDDVAPAAEASEPKAKPD